MVNRCVAAGCSNTHNDGVSLHKFPIDPVLKDKWVKQVRRTRAKWTATKYSVLCSEHFSVDSFQVESQRLKLDAVPSIFPRQSATGAGPSTSRKRAAVDVSVLMPSKRIRPAVEKRERARVSYESLLCDSLACLLVHNAVLCNV